MENPIDPKLIEDLKRASQEIEGVEEIQPQVSPSPPEEGAKEKPVDPVRSSQEIKSKSDFLDRGGKSDTSNGVEVSKEVPKKIDWDLENHLSEIVEARKRLEEKRNKIQSRLQLIINLENRIRRVLSERKKIDEDLGKMKNTENF